MPTEYKKGSLYYSSASEYLHKAIVHSRLCGAEKIELRALANSATVNCNLENNILAIRHYHQCCILCRITQNDATLKQNPTRVCSLALTNGSIDNLIGTGFRANDTNI